MKGEELMDNLLRELSGTGSVTTEIEDTMALHANIALSLPYRIEFRVTDMRQAV
ncbi:MAG: hypothetical protein ACI8UO_005492 [Verrucomicrobiales bacterium]